ncbi:hypothetical protein M433DRAFT_8798 [Acidomyces richmondensis BFW]|nr:hypothetical protein M433DRAFT_8798 [Acidomyces richmondensis BFW]
MDHNLQPKEKKTPGKWQPGYYDSSTEQHKKTTSQTFRNTDSPQMQDTALEEDGPSQEDIQQQQTNNEQ